jgi:hypothetical protein
MKDQVTYPLGARVFLVAYGTSVGLAYALLLNRAFSGSLLSGVLLCLALGAAFAMLASKFRPVKGMSFWKNLLMIPLTPFAFAAGLFGIAVFILILGAILPFIAVSQYWQYRQFARAMMQQGRFIEFQELRDRLSNGEGTLLEETGTKGPYRIWWTADDVLEFGSPIDDPEVWLAVLYERKQHAFNSYCVANYLDDRKGKALLTSVRPRFLTSGKISRVFPKAKRAVVVRPLPVDRTVDSAQL